MSSIPGPPRDPRYHLLDAWRGLACLMIVVHHAAYAIERHEARGDSAEAWLRWAVVEATKHLDLGVPLFFVISGYCIAASVASTHRRGASPWQFLARRVRRIYPPYWAAVLFFAGAVVALDLAGLEHLHRNPDDLAVSLDPPTALVVSQWAGNLTLTETVRPHLFGPDRNVFTAIAWSLCYEEQFYFVCFLALLLCRRRLVAALVVATAGCALLWIAARLTGRFDRLYGLFPALWHQFAVGLAVYYRLNLAQSAAGQRVVDAGLAALGAVALAGDDLETATAAAFGLVLIAFRPWDDRARSWGPLGPLRACGLRCYSIYLVHLPVVVVVSLGLYELGLRSFWARALVNIPLASAASLPVCWAFFAAVESRFLNPPLAPGNRPTPAASPAPAAAVPSGATA